MVSGDGTSPPKYTWKQAGEEIDIDFRVDADVSSKQIKCKFETRRMSLTVKGETVFSSDLAGAIDPDESSWSLEGSGDKRKLIVNITKTATKEWPALSLEEAKAKHDDFTVVGLEFENEERVENQEGAEKELEAKYLMLKQEKGIEDEKVLECFFELFDNCIQLYRLNKMSKYLEEIVPHCRTRNDKYKLKAIQALGFVRWKQSEFREALGLFHEMEDMLGKNAALCENIAHTYNSLGDYPKAEEYFRDSLKFIEAESGSNQGNRGGVLLGLGLVRDRLGQHEDALKVVEKAYNFYKDKARGQPSSLQAKAGMSCAKILMKLERPKEAEKFCKEAVTVYEVTCGEFSPLTASAYEELGNVQWAMGKKKPAQEAFKRAYEIESKKDAFNLLSILEIHNALMDTHLKDKDNIDRRQFDSYFPIAEYTVSRVKELPQDGNAAVYYKAAAELFCWGGSYQRAFELFEEAIGLLEVEKAVDTSSLVESCTVMRDFCSRNLAGAQDSPMVLDVRAREREQQGYADRKLTKEEKKLVKEIEKKMMVAEPPTEEGLPCAASGSNSKPKKKIVIPKITATSVHKVQFARQFAEENNFNNQDVTRWLMHVGSTRQTYGLPPGDFIDELVVRLSEVNGPELVADSIRKYIKSNPSST
eukprot:gene292-1057_t